MFAATKEVLQEPFCTEIGISSSEQKELVCCWKCISMNIVEVCAENVSQTDPDWNVFHLWKLNSISIYPIPTLFDCLSVIDTYVPKR